MGGWIIGIIIGDYIGTTIDYYWGFYRDYYGDPFPRSLLSTRELNPMNPTPKHAQDLGFRVSPQVLRRSLGSKSAPAQLKP